MKKLLAALQSQFDSLPVIGEVRSPPRGRYRPYAWKLPPLGASGTFEGIALHHYLMPKMFLTGKHIAGMVQHIARHAPLGFSAGSLQTTLGNEWKLTRMDKLQLIPNSYTLINTLRSAYRPAVAARLMRYAAETNGLEFTQAGEGSMLVNTAEVGWCGFHKDNWLHGGFKMHREPFFPPAANIKLSGLLENTPYAVEEEYQQAMRWLVQEELLTPDFELALKIAFQFRQRDVRLLLKNYTKRT